MFRLKIKTDNAAFTDSDDESEEGEETCEARRSECARILRQIAKQLENGADDGMCSDANGNSVGNWYLDQD